MGLCLVELALLLEDIAQVVVRLGVVWWLSARACSNRARAWLEFALFAEDIAQVVVGLADSA